MFMFRAFKVIYSYCAPQNTTFGTKFMAVGPCVPKIWPKKSQILWIFVKKRDKEVIQTVFVPPKHSVNVYILLLTSSRHSGVQFGTL